jgi:hypothetical protein
MRSAIQKMFGSILSLLVLEFGIINDIQAQGQLYIRTGINYSWLHNIGQTGNLRYGEPVYDSRPAFYMGFSYQAASKKFVRLESSFDLTAKFVSMVTKIGGLGSYTITDADYELYYTDLSVYPVFYFGNKLKFVASIRPNFGFMVASHRSGESTSWSQGTIPYESPIVVTGPVSGNATEEFSSVTFDLLVNLRIEYPISDNLGIMLECLYSMGLNNISNYGDYHYNFNNVKLGTGILVKLSENNIH